jgi:hypothetical protein
VIGKSRKSKSKESKSKGKKKKRKVSTPDPESEEESDASEENTTESEDDPEAPYLGSSDDELQTPVDGTCIPCQSPDCTPTSYLGFTAPTRTSERLSTIRTGSVKTVRHSSPIHEVTSGAAESEEEELIKVVKPIRTKDTRLLSGDRGSNKPEAKGTKRLREVSDSQVETAKKAKLDMRPIGKVGPPKTVPKPPSGFRYDHEPTATTSKSVATTSKPVATTSKSTTSSATKRSRTDSDAAIAKPAKKVRGWDEEVKAQNWSQATLNQLAIQLMPDVMQISYGEWEAWCNKAFIKPMLTQEGGLWSALRTFYYSSPNSREALDNALASAANAL